MAEELLLSVIAIEAALLATALLMLIGHAVFLATRQRWQRPRLAEAAGILRAGLEGNLPDDEDLDRLAKLSTNAQIGLFSDFSSSLRGRQKQRLAEIATDVGLTEKAERWCASRRWGKRLRGARLLTLLGGGERIVPPLLDDSRPEVRAQAAQWAGGHPDPASIERVLSMLADSETLCRFTVKDSLLRVGPAATEPLLRHLAEGEGVTAEALEVAVGIADTRFLEPALKYRYSPDPRTRALATVLLGSVGGSQATAALTELLRDPDLDVRAAAARGLGKLGHWPAAATLAERLRDSSWDVRKASALALRALGAPGMLLLRRALGDRDRFAGEMAQQVLELPDGRGHVATREPALVS